MKYFQLVPSNINLDFIGKCKYFLVFSIVMIVAIASGVASKGLNYGIDFTGGVVIQARFNPALTAEQVRAVMAELGEPDASVVSLQGANSEYLMTVREIKSKESQPLNQRLTAKLGSDKVTILQVDNVGPKVGAELKRAALLSLLYSILLITIYIWFRFDIRFAPGATIAMVHDLMMATGFYLVSGNEFTITAVAALLTIAGYSVNDTIVIYDRVREMIERAGASLPLPETINKAINATLGRTFLTAGVTLISIIPIIFYCSGEIQNFAIAMAFGLLVGTYSTIYVASPFTIYVENFLNRRKGIRSATA